MQGAAASVVVQVKEAPLWCRLRKHKLLKQHFDTPLCRRMKAAFAKYKEEQLPILRQDKPGLKLTQYQDMIFKNWQKSPQNPLVRAQLAGK